MTCNPYLVTFGEIMMRLSPPDHLRFSQATTFDLLFAGAEANVAIGLTQFGVPVQFVTAIPANDLGAGCLQQLRRFGVGVDFAVRRDGRLGLYFLEKGAGNRPSRVIYDRANSVFSNLSANEIEWDQVFAGAGWFHWSGINPALSEPAAETVRAAVAAAVAARVPVSCDLNYRHYLWRWGKRPAEVMPELVAECDLLVANGAHLMLDIPTEDVADTCDQLSRRFPRLRQIALTSREVLNPTHQQFTAYLWQAGRLYVSHRFDLTAIVDRVGSGDAFMAGLLFGLREFGDNLQQVVDFAAASAVLKHSIAGDANLVTIQEVQALLSQKGGLDIIR